MKISVLITTYGDHAWAELSWSRAYPSTIDQGADEVIVRHWPDLTIGPARNATAEEAEGGFLIFLDADDELEDGYIDAMRTAADTLADEIDYAPEWTLFQPAVSYIRKNRRAAPLMREIGDLRVDNFLVIGTMVSKQLFDTAGGFSDYEHGFEDWSCWAKCWKAGATIVQVPDALYLAHVNPKSKHRQAWRNRREQVAMHLRVQAELFPEGVG